MKTLSLRLTVVAFVLVAACGGRVATSEREEALDEGSPGVVAAPPPPPPSAAPADPADVWLAFDAVGASNSAIYVMRADGSELRKLELATSAAAPAFSFDGKHLAFAGADGIWVRELASGKTRRLTRGSDRVPAWSPDGRKLAFTREIHIYTIDADGTNERPYIEGPPPGQAWYSNYGHPSFTLDGRSLVFGRRGAIEMGDLDRTNIRPILEVSSGTIVMAALAPDGAHLAISGGCDGFGQGDLRTVAIDAAARTCDIGAVIGHGGLPARPSWSAGGLIAFADGRYEVRVVSASGGQAKTVLDTTRALRGEYVYEVAWSVPGSVVP